MEKLFTFIYPELSLEDKVSIRRVLRAGRAQVLNSSLEVYKSADRQSQLGEWAPVISQFFAEMDVLCRTHPDLFWRFVDHWSMSFLLSRIMLDDQTVSAERVGQLCSNLTSLLLVERLLKGTALAERNYRVRLSPEGRLHSFFHGVALEFTDERLRGQTLVWKFEGGEAKIQVQGSQAAAVSLSVPLTESPLVRIVPVSHDAAVAALILGEKALMGPQGVSRAPDPNVVETNDPHWRPRPLAESLTYARGVIARLMPEALDWIDLLAPAFIDLGEPRSQVIRASGSYEPGSPIFLSRVAEPLHHAEDLVHEVQHHRLHLIAGETHFKSWNDLRPVFVSPYRSDPRPLRGLLIGIHAFVTVNELQRRMIHDGLAPAGTAREMAETHYKNLFALRTLMEYEQFSDASSRIMEQMAAMVCEQHSEVQRLAPPESAMEWRRNLTSHIERVRRQASELLNGSLDYLNWENTVQLAASWAEGRIHLQ